MRRWDGGALDGRSRSHSHPHASTHARAHAHSARARTHAPSDGGMRVCWTGVGLGLLGLCYLRTCAHTDLEGRPGPADRRPAVVVAVAAWVVRVVLVLVLVPVLVVLLITIVDVTCIPSFLVCSVNATLTTKHLEEIGRGSSVFRIDHVLDLSTTHPKGQQCSDGER